MRSILMTFCLLTACVIAKAQENYAVSLIPKNLLPYANAVIRDDEETVEVNDPDDATYHIKEAVTIFNKNGDDMAHIDIEHDKSTIIKNVKGYIYNEFGKQTGKFSENDFDDASAWDGYSLFTDAKVKHYFPSVTDYPYTIVYEYELRFKQTLALPGWKPNPYFGVAVEKSSFSLSCRPDFDIRYKETNFTGKVDIGKKSGLKTYTWAADNLKAIKDEPFSPYPLDFLTDVQLAPEKFSYYGIEGSYTNWKELGKWEYDKLLADRQDLPEETINYVKELTKNITDPKLKAKKIYEYMQSKTHYISVQVGIGGNQPFLASDVDKQNYGDCKALVNYTQALLKAVNIDSYYCVVEANNDYKISLSTDFASLDQGNHIILCLPFKNDTTWADCTSETIPFGYLGSFTDDRNVLACTPEGGKIMRTPKYTAKTNVKTRKAEFAIDANGVLTGNMTTTFKGADYEYRDELITESRTDQIKTLQKIYPINNLEIESFDLKQDKSFDPVTTENIKLQARDYASLTDGKYYFMVNPVNRIDGAPPEVRNRTTDVYIPRGYTDIDEVTYALPAGYHLEKEPLNVSLDKPFGKFTATMTLNGNQLIYKRTLQFNGGTYSKDTYQDLVDFYQDIDDADGYTVSLIKNQ